MTRKSNQLKSNKDVKPLLREFFQLEKMSNSANERQREIKNLLLLFMQKKKITHLDSGDRRLLYVDPKTTVYDLDEIKNIIKDPKIKKKANKNDIDLDELIITTEKLNTSVFEDLLKSGVIPKKKARELISITDGTAYLRSSNVPKSGTK